jgi:pimeloyl-ACP methyl ester carboxylesterase
LNSVATYQALREPRHETVRVRGLGYHLTRWGPGPAPLEPTTLLMHGWLDAGGTFQFMVDAFARDRSLIALDWRGFGGTEWPQRDYTIPEYLGDLDALLDILSPERPVRLVGHSMGGNIATLYAGLRPERVRCLINLEGFGLTRTAPADAPRRLRKWLDQVRKPLVHKEYNSFEQLAAVINYRYPRVTAAQAAFVSRIWGRMGEDGRVILAADPRHHWINPLLYKREDAEAIWAQIRAPMVMLMGTESEYATRLGVDGTVDALRATFPTAEIEHIAAAGHMLHIERPEAAAPLVERFLEAH